MASVDPHQPTHRIGTVRTIQRTFLKRNGVRNDDFPGPWKLPVPKTVLFRESEETDGLMRLLRA